MPNAIKYNTSAETLALKKGNFWIGTGDVGKGPTSSTGYYNGITPPSGGYTIYLNKASGGPSIYTVSTVAELTGLTSTIAGQTLTTSGACLNWFATQTDKMIFNIDYPAIVTNGLVLNLDAAFTPSYSQSGVTWYDVSSGGNNGTLTNGPTFNSANGGSIVFDGIDDYTLLSNVPTFDTELTYCGFVYPTNLTGNRAIFSFGGVLLQVNVDIYKYWSRIQLANFNITATGFNLNQWNFIAISQKNNQLTCYYNSNNLGTITVNSNPTGGGFKEIARFGEGDRQFAGNMGNFLFYNRALTAAEVLQNYNALKGRFGLS